MKPAKVKWYDPDSKFKSAGAVKRVNDIEYVAQGDGGKDPKAIYQKYHDNEFLDLHPPNIKCQPTKKGGGGVGKGGGRGQRGRRRGKGSKGSGKK